MARRSRRYSSSSCSAVASSVTMELKSSISTVKRRPILVLVERRIHASAAGSDQRRADLLFIAALRAVEDALVGTILLHLAQFRRQQRRQGRVFFIQVNEPVALQQGRLLGFDAAQAQAADQLQALLLFDDGDVDATLVEHGEQMAAVFQFQQRV